MLSGTRTDRSRSIDVVKKRQIVYFSENMGGETESNSYNFFGFFQKVSIGPGIIARVLHFTTCGGKRAESRRHRSTASSV